MMNFKKERAPWGLVITDLDTEVYCSKPFRMQAGQKEVYIPSFMFELPVFIGHTRKAEYRLASFYDPELDNNIKRYKIINKPIELQYTIDKYEYCNGDITKRYSMNLMDWENRIKYDHVNIPKCMIDRLIEMSNSMNIKLNKIIFGNIRTGTDAECKVCESCSCEHRKSFFDYINKDYADSQDSVVSYKDALFDYLLNKYGYSKDPNSTYYW